MQRLLLWHSITALHLRTSCRLGLLDSASVTNGITALYRRTGMELSAT